MKALAQATTYEDELDALRRVSYLKARYVQDSDKAVIQNEFDVAHEELVTLERQMIDKHRSAQAILTAMLDLARRWPMPALDTLRAKHGLDLSFGEAVCEEVIAL